MGLCKMKPNLAVKIGSLALKNPVMAASGTFGYGEEFHESIYDISKLGAVVIKGISLRPREGNPMPRTVETPSGLLNAIGLANVGIEVFLKEKLPFLKQAGATVIVNIFGGEVEEYANLASILDKERDVAAVEVNISCPNVKEGGIHFGADPKLAEKVTDAVKKEFSRTVIVKLSPQVTSIAAIAMAVKSAGADAVSLINTIPAMAIDWKKRRPILANGAGGLSGPAIKPVALKMVWDVSRAVEIPVIGIGGILTAEDAIEFMLAGALAIQVGSANFTRPKAAIEIISDMVQYCREEKISSISEVVGALKV